MPVNITNTGSSQPNQPAQTNTAPQGFMKKGAGAQEMVSQEQAFNEQKKEANKNKVHRFFCQRDGAAKITFLDGALTEDKAFFDVPAIKEHNLRINGRWGNTFPCIADTEPCPCCQEKEGGDPYVVAFFTVIDHTPFTKNGKTYRDQVKLFAAKSGTMTTLLRHAQKSHIDGLAGCTFDVFRQGDKSAAVGTEFEFVEKNDVGVLCSHFTKVNNVAAGRTEDSTEYPVGVINYEASIQYLNGEQLRAMGIGGYVPGSESSIPQYQAPMGAAPAPTPESSGVMGGSSPAPQSPSGGVMGGGESPFKDTTGGGVMSGGGSPSAQAGVMSDSNLADEL
jgi:hypothetical protein